MDTWTRRIEGNLFFFFSFSHWISYLECMYTQNPAASISIYNNPKEKKKKKKKKKKKRVLIQLFLYLHASATIFPNIIIFQYSDFCLLREGGGKQAARWRIIFLILTTK